MDMVDLLVEPSATAQNLNSIREDLSLRNVESIEPSIPTLHATTTCQLCESCKTIFMDKTTYKRLASRQGVAFERHRKSMARTALDGCRLCRQLLCMPSEYEYRSVYSGWTRDANYSRWPLQDWESAVKESTTSSKEFRFRLRGNLSYQHYIEVTRRRCRKFSSSKKLLFEVSTREGMLKGISNSFGLCWMY
jgi:hypothetical protein